MNIKDIHIHQQVRYISDDGTIVDAVIVGTEGELVLLRPVLGHNFLRVPAEKIEDHQPSLDEIREIYARYVYSHEGTHSGYDRFDKALSIFEESFKKSD